MAPRLPDRPWYARVAQELPCLAIYAASVYYAMTRVLDTIAANTDATRQLVELVERLALH